MESDIKSVRDDFSATQESSEQVRTKIEYLSWIVGLVLGSERVANAVYVQDFTDRGAERWLTLPTDAEVRRPQAPMTAEALLQQRNLRPQTGWEALSKPTPDVVSIDW